MKPFFLFPSCALLLLLSLAGEISAVPFGIPRLSPYDRHKYRVSSTSTPSPKNDDFKTYFYRQTLDHFNYAPASYSTFQQRYVVNAKHWRPGPGSKSPIFAYLGAEAPIDGDIEIIGFINDNAPDFGALCVYIEHRFYGESIPFGTMKKAMANKTTRGYFNSAQAIADYAQILLHVKHQFSAHKSPIIVIGGSYGGMLASWFRLKYPHIALGALASSAPILYFDKITPQNGYYSLVTKDFKEASKSCYETIQDSWAEVDRVAATPHGLATLCKAFKTCSKLKSVEDLKDHLWAIYGAAAQYNRPPDYPVTKVCRGIDSAPSGSNIIHRIAAGMFAYAGDAKCYDIGANDEPSETAIGWQWQSCSEMVMPIGTGVNDTMFPASPYNLTDRSKHCTETYGVQPRPHWITTYYGGHDIKLILKRFGSNIIFSNGLRDPYSSGGVLEDLSKSINAVTTRNGSHCLDILMALQTDPEWLKKQRKTEVKIIQGWISTYYRDKITQ